MVETISFISAKMSEQSGVPVALIYLDDGSRSNFPITQDINSVDSCTARVSVHIPGAFAISYQGDLYLSFAKIDPRDVHLLALSDWKRTIEPPTFIPGNVNSQTDHNLYENTLRVRVDPDRYIVTYGDAQHLTPFLGVFSDKRIADRVATAYIHAFSLCHKAEAF